MAEKKTKKPEKPVIETAVNTKGEKEIFFKNTYCGAFGVFYGGKKYVMNAEKAEIFIKNGDAVEC